MSIRREGQTAEEAHQRSYYAHSLKDLPPPHWELLETHLHSVAKLAQEFASKFNAGAWGRQLGLWHDLGKYSEEFQDYLLTQNGFEAHLEAQSGRVDHSTAGTQHAKKQVEQFGPLLAYCIAGHHAGLADWYEVTT